MYICISYTITCQVNKVSFAPLSSFHTALMCMDARSHWGARAYLSRPLKKFCRSYTETCSWKVTRKTGLT